MNCTVCNNPIVAYKVHIKSLIGFNKPIAPGDVVCCSAACVRQYYADLKASRQNGG